MNILRRWHVPTSTGYFAKDTEEQESEDEVPTWDDGGSGEPRVGEQLDEAQRGELGALLAEFDGVLQKYPGHTQLTEHGIETGEAHRWISVAPLQDTWWHSRVLPARNGVLLGSWAMVPQCPLRFFQKVRP